MEKTRRSLVLAALLGALLGGAPANSADAPPSYTLQFLGAGSVVAINNANTVVGVRTSATTGTQTPLISENGGAWTILPSPAGASSAFPTDINDSRVIVGVATMASGRRAIRWTPAGAAYAVEVLPLLPGELASYATGINNLGQIVGARAGILGTPYGFGWLYSDAEGLVDLNARYGWFATPADINDAGVILSGTQTLDLATRTVTDVGLPAPYGYNPVSGVAINEGGQIFGSAILSSSSLNIVSVFRYSPGTGWEYVSGTSRYTVAIDINNLGDLCWSEQGAGILFEGLGKYYPYSLLDPAVAAAGWTITGYGCVLNDQRVLATIGRNSLTSESGAVLLTPSGTLSPPAAPTGLTATPHPATPSEPYLSIDLSWSNGDPLLTRSYELERRNAGQTAWTPVALVPPAMSTFHQDTTVASATTYDYRVRAVGVAGPGPWSGIASATSPAISQATALRVSGIALSAKVRGGRVHVTGIVQVRDGFGLAVAGANVAARWTLPGGGTRTAAGVTDAAGRARFTTSGPRGTYTLTVADVALAGYIFDAAGSVLSRSITR